MRRKLLVIVGIVILFIIVFVLAIFMTLPTESIRHLAEKTIEKQLKQEQSVEIGDLSVSPLLNVTLKNFSMRPRNVDTSAENFATEGGDYNGFWCAPYVEEQPFVIDEIFVNPSILKVLKKKPAGEFELKIQDGTINGELKSADKMMAVSAQAKEISMNEFALLSNLTKMQIYGELGFDLRAVMEQSKLAELQLEMSALNTALCPKRVKLNSPSLPYFDLPFTVFGNIDANLEIKDNKLVIHKLQSDGPDIKLDVVGDVMLKSEKNPTPRFSIEADIAPSEDWITSNNMKLIYQLCEKHDDGSIHLSLSGTTKKPKFDCGTPIPEPVAEPTEEEKAAAEAKKLEKEEAKKKAAEEKKAAEDAKKAEEKAAADAKKAAEDAKRAEEENRDSDTRSRGIAKRDPNDVGRPDRVNGGERMRMQNRPNMQRNGRAARPGARSGERGFNGDPSALRGVDRLNDNAEREMRRRNRERGFNGNSN